MASLLDVLVSKRRQALTAPKSAEQLRTESERQDALAESADRGRVPEEIVSLPFSFRDLYGRLTVGNPKAFAPSRFELEKEFPKGSADVSVERSPYSGWRGEMRGRLRF